MNSTCSLSKFSCPKNIPGPLAYVQNEFFFLIWRQWEMRKQKLFTECHWLILFSNHDFVLVIKPRNKKTK